MKRFAGIILVGFLSFPLAAQWTSGTGSAAGTIRTSSRVGIGAFFSDSAFPRFHIEVGRQWDQRPTDMISGPQTMGGASIDGDVFLGNINPGVNEARGRVSANHVQGFFHWNLYYSTTGLKIIDTARAAYGLNFGGNHTIGNETANAVQNGVTFNRYVPDGNGGVTGTTLLSVDKDGNVSASGTINANYQDVAEWVPGEGDIPAGTVVVLHTEKTNFVVTSSLAYDSRVAGVISEKPGLLLGSEGESKSRVATLGRVKVSVDASKRPVRVGDLLVTSDRPGMAMASEPIDVGGVKIHRPGTLIGKALEPLESGQGQILVLLSMQ
jgi:hypothetical protein